MNIAAIIKCLPYSFFPCLEVDRKTNPQLIVRDGLMAIPPGMWNLNSNSSYKHVYAPWSVVAPGESLFALREPQLSVTDWQSNLELGEMAAGGRPFQILRAAILFKRRTIE